MANENKRNSDHLSPPIKDAQRRYCWDPEDLLKENPFYPIQENDNQVSDASEPIPSTSMESESEPPKPKTKIPPIFLPTAKYQEVLKDLKKIVKHDFTTNSNDNCLKVNLTNIEDYKILTKAYTEAEVNFYTYRDPTSRPLSVVIKNTPVSLTEEEIMVELIEQYNLHATKVTRLRNKNRKPTLIVAVDLPNNDDSKKIFKIEKLCHAIVRIEPRKNNQNIPQCFRCQRYGHTKNYCNMEFRCVKCSGNHHYKDCTKANDTPPTCVNCNESHPANYRGCKYFESYQQKVQQQNYRSRPVIPRNPQNNYNNSPNNFTNLAHNNDINMSYAAAVNPNQNILSNLSQPMPNYPINTHQTRISNHNQQIPQPQSSPILEQILHFILNLITPHLETIKTFIINNVIPSIFDGSK